MLGIPLAATKKTGEVFSIRQISRIVGTTGGGTRQIHILTTDRTLPAGEVVHRMGNRWREETQFRYARMHFDLDSHDSYSSADDNEDRKVPNPATANAYQKVVAARNAHAEAAPIADINLMALKTPAEGSKELTITDAGDMHDQAMAPLWKAKNALIAAEKAHKKIPAELRLGDLNPGLQVLDTEVKLIHTGYRRAIQEAHAFMRQIFNQPGEIDTTKPGHFTITLDPLPTTAKTAAAPLTLPAPHRYPGTALIFKYAIKTKPPALFN